MTQKLDGRLPAALLLFSLLLNVGFLFEQEAIPPTDFFRHNPAFDSSRFLNEAKLMGGNGFYGSINKRSQPPVYPLLIATINGIFDSGESALLLFQAVMNTCSLALIYFIALACFGRVEALIALAVGTLYGPFIFYGGLYLRASLVTFESLAVVALLLAAARKKTYLNSAAGIMTALFTLTRQYPLSVIAVFAWFAYKLFHNPNKKSAYGTICFVASFFTVYMILSPPQVFRGIDEGQTPATDSTNGLSHFFSGNVLDSDYGYTWGDTPIKLRLLKESEGSIAKGALLVFSEIIKDPFEYAKFYFKKMKILLGGFEPPSNYNFHLFKNELSNILPVAFVSFGWIVPFALIGLWEHRRTFRSNSLLYIWLLVLTLSIFIFPIQSRYRLPVVPFFIIFASGGIVSLYVQASQRNLKRFTIMAMVVVAALFLFRTDPSPLPGEITSEDYYNLETAYRKAGDEAKAGFYNLKRKRMDEVLGR